MRQTNEGGTAKASPSAFSIYLRTGKRTSPSPVEFKFNPYHDPQDGRFTFAPGGGTSGHAGGQAPQAQPVRSSSPKHQGASAPRRGDRWRGGGVTAGGGGSTGGAGATGDGYWLNPEEFAAFKLKHPTMEPVVVKPGDTVDSLAQAHHLTAAKLAAANRMAVNAKVKPGDVLSLPSHKAPSRKTDPVADTTTSVIGVAATRDPYRHEVRNEYDYSIDSDSRTRRAKGGAIG